ncbi:MAG: 3-hydroxyacyl-CoA dehydrogenase [Chloroflexi bacterium]|nr:MAG: 3-hydroxyacyl-CoA dehydrogenase [Chloroflexota bacterium]
MEFEAIKVISVFGAGTMGHGIAQIMAQQGYKVFLGDISQELLDAALDRVKKSLQKLAEKGKISQDEVEGTLSMITGTVDMEEITKDADFLIEAIPERLDIKKELFRQLDKVCKEETILATNTSTLSITELASATERPERFIGMHFFNPVPLMNIVEIVKGLLTSDETVEITRKLVLKLGKEPIIVRDSPGFASSRLGVALFLEASRMLEEGVASAEDIDKSMRLGYGHRMGPFETCDLVGLDARLNNINAIYEATRDPAWKPPQLLKQLVSAGYLGRKPGSKGGYYTYFGFEK